MRRYYTQLKQARGRSPVNLHVYLLVFSKKKVVSILLAEANEQPLPRDRNPN